MIFEFKLSIDTYKNLLEWLNKYNIVYAYPAAVDMGFSNREYEDIVIAFLGRKSALSRNVLSKIEIKDGKQSMFFKLKWVDGVGVIDVK